MTFGKPSKATLLVLFITTVFGAILGGIRSDFFMLPDALSSEWDHMSSLRVVDKDTVARGAHQVGDELRIIKHEAFDSDRVKPIRNSPIDKIGLSLAPNSGIVQANIGGGSGYIVLLKPGWISLDMGHVNWNEVDGNQFTFTVDSEGITVNDGLWRIETSVGPGPVELRAYDGIARLIEVDYLSDNEPVLSFKQTHSHTKYLGALMGIVFGLFIGFGVMTLLNCASTRSTWVFFSLLTLFPILLISPPLEFWFVWTERLLISDPKPWWVAWGLVSYAVFLLGIFIFVQMIEPKRLRRRSAVNWHHRKWHLWFLLAVICLVRSWQAGFPLWASLSVLIFLFILPLTAHRLSLSHHLALWDMPALIIFIGLTDVAGFLMAVVWRFLVWSRLLSRVRPWKQRAMADAMFVLSVISLVALEMDLRQAVVSRNWIKPAMASASSIGEFDNVNSWSAQCGDGEKNEMRQLVFVGGSSTGGAYQYGLDQSQAFPVYVHQAICARLGPDQSLKTMSFAGADRNTHTISRQIDQIVEVARPDTLAIYAGVNDVLSRQSSQTAAEREANSDTPEFVGVELPIWASRSAIIRGFALAFRVPPQSENTVAEVPVADAKKNIERIVTAVSPGKTLLLTELTKSMVRPQLDEYQIMQAKIAAMNEDVSHLHLDRMIPSNEFDPLLLDVNHMSAEGAKRLASTLEQPLHEMLFSAESVSD